MDNSDIVKRGIVGLIILSIFVFAFLVLKPILIAIIFGLLFAYIFNPLYDKLYKKTKRKNLSAFLIIVGLTALVTIPVIYIVPGLVSQVFETYVSFQGLDFSEIFGQFGDGAIIGVFADNINEIIRQLFSGFLGQLTSLLVNLPSMMLQFAVFLFTFFFAVRDSDTLKKYVSRLSPFSKNMEGTIMKEFKGITNAILFGQVFIGLVQGLALGLGLLVLGVPNTLILTVVASIFAIIPLIGAWLVYLPVGAYLLINGQVLSGIFLLLYGTFFVSTVDNFLRPYILSKRSNLPIPISIIGTIGGLYFFGISGLLLGPLILAYALIIMEFYQQGRLNELFHGKNEVKN